MDELAQKKIEAEITLLNAQAAKFDADRISSSRSFGQTFIEFLKVAGALIIGAGGVTAAITGYQLMEVKKERMQLEIDGLQRNVKEQNEQLLDRTRKIMELETAITNRESKLEAYRIEIASYDAQIVEKKKDLAEVNQKIADTTKAAPTTSDTSSLDLALTRKKQIETEIKTADSQFRSALARIEATDTAVRTQAVNSLAFQYSSSPEAKAAILTMLGADAVNKLSEQGLINCLVILARHKATSWSKPQLELAHEAIKRLEQRKLSERERWALDELKSSIK